MSSIGTTLLDNLRSVVRPGDFCVGGIREIFMPTIDLDGVGSMGKRSEHRECEESCRQQHSRNQRKPAQCCSDAFVNHTT